MGQRNWLRKARRGALSILVHDCDCGRLKPRWSQLVVCSSATTVARWCRGQPVRRPTRWFGAKTARSTPRTPQTKWSCPAPSPALSHPPCEPSTTMCRTSTQRSCRSRTWPTRSALNVTRKRCSTTPNSWEVPTRAPLSSTDAVNAATSTTQITKNEV